MKKRHLASAFALMMASSYSQAALIDFNGNTYGSASETNNVLWELDENNRITSGYNLDINGVLWDLDITGGTVGGAVATQAAFSQQEATDFSNAIINQLLVNTSFGDFDDDFTLVSGCEAFSGVGRCGISTLYFYGTIVDEFYGYEYDQANFMAARNVNGDADQYGNQERASANGYGLPYWENRDLSENFAVLANWSEATQRSSADGEGATSVNAPATFGLMLMGAGAIGFRRKKSTNI